MANYCATPPFLSTSVPPNILFVIDKSGSMSWSAYNPDTDGTGWCESSSGCGWTYKGDEEGYFIPNKVYEYSGSYPDGVWRETTHTPDSCPNRWEDVYDGGSYLGSCLNFLLMSRVDLLRWAITGGRPEGCNGISSTSCDPSLVCTGSTCTIESLYSDKVEVPISRIKGILQIFENQENRPRFGALFYSSSIYDHKVYIGDYLDGQNADPDHPYTYLKRAINYIDPGGGTGTAPAMWEAYDYFKQSNDHYYGNGFDIEPGTYKDPNYICDYKGDDCIPAPCAKNFVILASDGQWNRGGYPISGTCKINTGFEDNSADPVVPAYQMHVQILRQLASSSGNVFDISVDGVFALGLFLGGTGEQSLKNVAVYGSFNRDKVWPDGTNGSHWNGSNTQYPWDTCYMDDCGNGRGSACTPLPPSSPDWDKNGDGEPDSFLNAKNALDIKKHLTKFIRYILMRTASGTSLSILAEKRKSGAVVSQAVFYPRKNFGDYEVTWVGSIFNYWALNTRRAQNLREDSYANLYLDIYSTTESLYDHILEFLVDNRGELNILRIRGNPDGTAKLDDSVCPSYTTASSCNASDYCVWDSVSSSCILNLQKTSAYCANITDITDCDNDQYCIYSYINDKCLIDLSAAYDVIDTKSSLDELSSLWNAGEKLRTRSADSRNIYGVVEDGTGMKAFTTANKVDFDGALGSSDFPDCLKTDGEPDYEKLIEYIRGKDFAGCRQRATGIDNTIWKLGDIIYSTPKAVIYSDKGYSVIFVGANDGMLHAFKAGYLSKDGLSANQAVKLCGDKNKCSTSDLGRTELGEELWAFIPRNVMPYLRYLANPDYCHLYFVDLKPYIIKTDYDGDDQEETVLIGGMRLGGGCGCTGSECTTPPSDTCSDPTDASSCIGYSSYFALDITDPEDPLFLWEFSHPDLGLSYSGPAHIRYEGNHYIMFVSGPTDADGNAGLPLKIFVLKLNNQFKYSDSDVYVIEPSGFDNTFGGRLFTEGIDYNEDGNTDMVAFGISKKTGTVWQGNVVGLKINSTDPNNWEFIKIFNSAIQPITTKVEYMKCFGMNYIYFGTGRWFYKLDEPGQNANDKEAIYGIRIDGCLTGSNCNVNSAHNVVSACEELENGTSTVAWMLSEDLLAKDDRYFKERSITDPTMVPRENIVIFTTMQPTADICGYGGRTRVWALNCATGAYAGEACPGTGSYATNIPSGTIYLQASGANIIKIKGLSGPSDWIRYTPPDTASQYVPPTGFLKGEILLWYEK
ncbi:pilus assembly protein [Persephonella sp.]